MAQTVSTSTRYIIETQVEEIMADNADVTWDEAGTEIEIVVDVAALFQAYRADAPRAWAARQAMLGEELASYGLSPIEIVSGNVNGADVYIVRARLASASGGITGQIWGGDYVEVDVQRVETLRRPATQDEIERDARAHLREDPADWADTLLGKIFVWGDIQEMMDTDDMTQGAATACYVLNRMVEVLDPQDDDQTRTDAAEKEASALLARIDMDALYRQYDVVKEGKEPIIDAGEDGGEEV